MSETEEPTTTSGIPASAGKAVDGPPSVPATTSAQAPIGQQRGVGFVIVLSIVTLSIYFFYWVYANFEEMKRHTDRGLGGVLALVIAIVIDPVVWFVMPSEVGRMYRDDERIEPVTGWTGLWPFLPIAGWFVWIIKIQGALNRYWESKAVAA